MQFNHAGKALRMLVIAAAAGLVAGCAASYQTASAPAQTSKAQASADQVAADFEADRKAILAMAGNYEVEFDFMETVSFMPGYELKERYRTGATEVVRVIEDRGTYIALQHILVATHNDQSFPIKHWRQDWEYQPETVLTYIGKNAWQSEPVAEADRIGAWSQVVYQVDDAPRYGAVARWQHEAGLSTWEPASAWRPLPRREATKRDDYDIMAGVNRHVITAWGWVHEQDNSKLISGENPKLLAREVGINSYRRMDEFPVEVAEAYWADTKDYWTEVRAIWDDIAAKNPRFGLTIQGEPAELYMPLLGLAEEVREGKKTADAALTEARGLIDEYTTLEVAAR